MNQEERRQYLIQYLLQENNDYMGISIPQETIKQKNLLRSLMNIRAPKEISKEFLKVQDEYLKQVNVEKGIITLDDIQEKEQGIYIYKGDITRLKVDAIVNAANSSMTGCYIPCHNCIDNCIHSYAGIELRNYCDDLIKKQGHLELTGKAKITPAFNLPCKYIIHTVGPIVNSALAKEHEDLLRLCYESCLEIAEKNNLDSIAFCCISTGVFHFPNRKAAEIAIKTIKRYKKEENLKIKVIFNVFKDEDEQIYEQLLG